MDVEITIKNYRCFSDEKPAQFVLREGLTAFSGANNSGKSSLLKFFYEFRWLFDMLSWSSGNLLGALNGSPQRNNPARTILDPLEVFCNFSNRPIEVQFQLMEQRANFDGITVTVQRDVIDGQYQWTAELRNGPPTNDKITGFEGDNNRLLKVGGTHIDFYNYYQLFKTLTKMIYVGPFRNAINVGTDSDYYDIRVGQAFIETWRNYKTGNVKQHNEILYRLTDDIKRIFGFNDLEINPAPDNTTLQVFVDGRSYTLAELGTGLAQFIIVLANIAIKQPSFLLIDEPELSLHPSLQLEFLNTLSSYTEHGVLFATHSIGLARVSNSQIYSVRKKTNGSSEVVRFDSTPRLSEFLGEMSFSSYRELGYDKLLLIEGKHDIKTFQQLLRKYNKEHRVVLLPIDGGRLIRKDVEYELAEIRRICDSIYVLIDSEKDSPDAPLNDGRVAFAESCRQMGIHCHILKLRAIENYLTDSAIKSIKGNKYHALGPYEAFKPSQNNWAKAENWKIAQAMSRDDLDKTDLGEFLKSL